VTTTSALSKYLTASTGSIDLSVPKPTISSIKPNSISSTSSSAKLTIKGNNFTKDTSVTVCSTGSSVSFKSTSQLVATVDATQLSAGKCDVKVTNLDGKNSTKKKAVTVK